MTMSPVSSVVELLTCNQQIQVRFLGGAPKNKVDMAR